MLESDCTGCRAMRPGAASSRCLKYLKYREGGVAAWAKRELALLHKRVPSLKRLRPRASSADSSTSDDSSDASTTPIGAAASSDDASAAGSSDVPMTMASVAREALKADERQDDEARLRESKTAAPPESKEGKSLVRNPRLCLVEGGMGTWATRELVELEKQMKRLRSKKKGSRGKKKGSRGGKRASAT